MSVTRLPVPPGTEDGGAKKENWRDSAACRGMGSDPQFASLFFPAEDKDVSPIVRRKCGSCPVRPECLEHALREHEPTGVWGGLTRSERDEVQRQRQGQRFLFSRKPQVHLALVVGQ